MCRPNIPWNQWHKNISTCPDQTTNMPARAQTCISTCVEKTHLMPPSSPHESQQVWTKPYPSLREHKINLNMCWPNQCHASQNTKCITCFAKPARKMYLNRYDQNPSMPARKQNVSQHVITNPIPCHTRTLNISQVALTKRFQFQRGHEMRHICWQNKSHAKEDTKFISTCITPNYSHASKDTKCISKCVDQTHPMPARTKIYQLWVNQTPPMLVRT